MQLKHLAYVLWIAPVLASADQAALSTPQTSATALPSYHLTRTIPLGAPDSWDYVTVDSAAHRVYVAHGDRVTVVDSRDGTRLGEVTGFPGGTHGVVVIPALARGYTDDGVAGVVAAFDLRSFKVRHRIKAEADADGMVFDSVSGLVYVINGDSGNLTAIDPKSDRVVATIAAGGKLEFGVAGENGKLYINGAGNDEIVRVDTGSNIVDAHWPVTGCTSPHGLAIDLKTHRLFSSCRNNVLKVVNTDTGAVVATLPIGAGTDAAAFDPQRRLVFSANGRDGTISVILERDALTYVTLGNIKTAPLARTMGIDPVSGRLYLVAAELDKAAAPNGPTRHRPAIVRGSAKLLFMDPMP